MSEFDLAMIDHTNRLFNALFNDGPVRMTAPVESPPADAPAPAEEFRPSRIHLVALVAHDFGVSQATAERWLVEEFGAQSVQP